MKKILLLALVCALPCLSGCFLTKILTVPVRVAAAAISVIPVAGNTVHDSLDTVAETIDEVPI